MVLVVSESGQTLVCVSFFFISIFSKFSLMRIYTGRHTSKRESDKERNPEQGWIHGCKTSRCPRSWVRRASYTWMNALLLLS